MGNFKELFRGCSRLVQPCWTCSSRFQVFATESTGKSFVCISSRLYQETTAILLWRHTLNCEKFATRQIKVKRCICHLKIIQYGTIIVGATDDQIERNYWYFVNSRSSFVNGWATSREFTRKCLRGYSRLVAASSRLLQLHHVSFPC